MRLLLVCCLVCSSAGAGIVSLESLLAEMTDREAVARFPEPDFRLKQQSSYNRASKTPDDPKGWFANHDYNRGSNDRNFIRIEEHEGRKEWVLMDHEGPGAIVRSWMPWLSDGNADTDIQIRIYLDGATQPVLEGNMLGLFNGTGLIPYPLAHSSLRSAVSFFPIPYAKHCKVTTTRMPFFFQFTFREYAKGTPVKTFTRADFEAANALMKKTGTTLLTPQDSDMESPLALVETLGPKQEKSLRLPSGAPAAIYGLVLKLGSYADPAVTRSVVLKMEFDGKETIWCPVGDFFGTGLGLHPFQGWERTVAEDGAMSCRWVMPYQNSGSVTLVNLGDQPVEVQLEVYPGEWEWDARSMYFHANWREQKGVPTRPYSDWNYVTLKGRGVYVGDTLTVMNPVERWWGEGDEKIWVDGESFPSIFGTGTEDYYGYSWGGISTDFYEHPFHAQVRCRDYDKLNRKTNAKEKNTQGYSTETRTRSLDAMPFGSALQLDMEVWSGTDCEMDYAVAAYWYGFGDTTSNRQPAPAEVAAIVIPPPVMPLNDVAMPGGDELFEADGNIPNSDHAAKLVELETVKQMTLSPGMNGRRQNIGTTLPPYKWSNNAQFLGRATNAGESVTFTLAGQSHPTRIVLYPALSHDYGILNFYVNDQLVVENWDGYATASHPGKPIDLGVHVPQGERFHLRAVVTGKNAKSTGYYLGLDAVELEDMEETETAAEVREFLESNVFEARPFRDWPQLVGVIKRPWATAAVAILWNPGASDESVTLDFAAAGLDPEREHAIWSYRDRNFLGFAKGSWATPELPAAGSQILRITELDRSRNIPVLIGSSLHKYCGGLEIRSFQPGPDDLQIELTDTGDRMGELYIHSRLGLFKRSATGCTVAAVASAGENLWKVSLVGRQSGQPQRVLLGLKVPLVQQRFFWLVVGVVLTAVLFGLWWSRHRYHARLALARLEQENLMERERGRIARDIHDDLGANLAEIAMLSELAQDGLPEDHPVRAKLDEIYVHAQSNVRQLGDIVWAINPGGGSLEQFTAHLCKFAQDYLALAQVRCRLDLPDTLPAVTLDSVQRHSLFSAAKEAIRNAVQHGVPTEVVLRLAVADDNLLVSIADNGRGFEDAPPATGAHGSANLRARMDQIGGWFTRRSAPGQGTTVTLSLPLSKLESPP